MDIGHNAEFSVILGTFVKRVRNGSYVKINF